LYRFTSWLAACYPGVVGSALGFSGNIWSKARSEAPLPRLAASIPFRRFGSIASSCFSFKSFTLRLPHHWSKILDGPRDFFRPVRQIEQRSIEVPELLCFVAVQSQGSIVACRQVRPDLNAELIIGVAHAFSRFTAFSANG
jgi:hypothetical protein